MPRQAAPRPGEPIGLRETSKGVRYRCRVDVGTKADGRRRQKSFTARTLTEARQWVEKTRTDVRVGDWTAPDRMKVSELVEQWLLSKRDIRDVTRGNYAHAAKRLVRTLGGRTVQSVGRADIDALITATAAERRGGLPLSRVTVDRVLLVTKMTFEHAVDSGIIARSPAARVERPRAELTDRKDVATWSVEEVVKFRAAADQTPESAWWRLTLCGLRRSEVLGLRWSDIDLDAGIARVVQSRTRPDGSTVDTVTPVKSKLSKRVVPIESLWPDTVAVLKAEKTRQARDRLAAGPAYQSSEFVVVDELGVPVRPEVFSVRFGRLVRTSGVPVIRLHSVRHSLALVMHRAGVAPGDAAGLLGHTLAVHLDAYLPMDERGTSSAATALGAALQKAQ